MYGNQFYPNYQNQNNYQQIPQSNFSQMNTFQQPTGLNGRFVQSADMIGVNDVPMNGTYSIFPKSDMTEIYAKAWDGNGNIQTLQYRLVTPDMAEKAEPTLAEQLQELREEMRAGFEKLQPKSRSTKLKKEVDENE